MLPRFRSRSIRKVKGKGTKFPFRYVKKKGGIAHCSICGVRLGIGDHGAKSRRIPSRIFGGVLCSRCSFEVLKLAGKVKEATLKVEDIDVDRRRFVVQVVVK